MANNRIFYAVQALGFAPHGVGWIPGSGQAQQPSGFVTAHGVQSVNINTQFNLEQVFELGQLELYENIEGIPNIEVTTQKVLDGYANFLPNFDGTDAPLAIAGSGGVQRREDVLMGEKATDSVWPRDIPGITSSGTNPPFGDGFTAHIQTVTISTNLGRTELFELGVRKPYYR